MEDRADAMCDLLMGAAFADKELHEAEKARVQEHLATLMPDGELSDELKARIAGFAEAGFDLAEVAGKFANDPKSERKALLEIVASVHAADGEYDLAEDDYLMAVAAALGLSKEDVSEHALDYEVENLKESMARLRPPPTPKKK